MTRTAALLLLSVLLLTGGRASAFQCGTRLVQTGDTFADVVSKCGEPAFKQTRQDAVVDRNVQSSRTTVIRTVVIDEWTYNLGPQSFMRILRFENGRLIDITEGNYGY